MFSIKYVMTYVCRIVLIYSVLVYFLLDILMLHNVACYHFDVQRRLKSIRENKMADVNEFELSPSFQTPRKSFLFVDLSDHHFLTNNMSKYFVFV